MELRENTVEYAYNCTYKELTKVDVIDELRYKRINTKIQNLTFSKPREDLVPKFVKLNQSK